GDVGLDRLEGAAHRVGGVRLQVPGVEVAGSADQEEQDTVDVAGPGRSVGLHQVRQGQAHAAGGQGARAEEVAPRQTVAELDNLLTLEIQHGSSPVLCGKRRKRLVVWNAVVLRYGTAADRACNRKVGKSVSRSQAEPGSEEGARLRSLQVEVRIV